MTGSEVQAILAHLKGDYRLMAELLYGSGLRLMECVRLRVKDIDFGYGHITVRDGKGLRDRITILPERLRRPLQLHLDRVQEIHHHDLGKGGGRAYLPFALDRKYRNANRSWSWQYTFSSAQSFHRSALRRGPASSCFGEKSAESSQSCYRTSGNP